MIAVFQNIEFQKFVKSRFPDIYTLDKSDLRFIELLKRYLKKNNTSTLILDSELSYIADKKLSELNGIKLAFMIRTNMKLKFMGAIKLFGFFKREDVIKNAYSSLISDDNGVYYYRYPDEINFIYLPQMTENNWLKCVNRLDYYFVTEFRKFEHSFQNIRISSIDNLEEKRKEIKAYYNTIKQIDNDVGVSIRYIKDFSQILEKFNILMSSLDTTNYNDIRQNLIDLKLRIKTFKQKYTETSK